MIILIMFKFNILFIIMFLCNMIRNHKTLNSDFIEHEFESCTKNQKKSENNLLQTAMNSKKNQKNMERYALNDAKLVDATKMKNLNICDNDDNHTAHISDIDFKGKMGVNPFFFDYRSLINLQNKQQPRHKMCYIHNENPQGNPDNDLLNLSNTCHNNDHYIKIGNTADYILKDKLIECAWGIEQNSDSNSKYKLEKQNSGTEQAKYLNANYLSSAKSGDSIDKNAVSNDYKKMVFNKNNGKYGLSQPFINYGASVDKYAGFQIQKERLNNRYSTKVKEITTLYSEQLKTYFDGIFTNIYDNINNIIADTKESLYTRIKELLEPAVVNNVTTVKLVDLSNYINIEEKVKSTLDIASAEVKGIITATGALSVFAIPGKVRDLTTNAGLKYELDTVIDQVQTQVNAIVDESRVKAEADALVKIAETEPGIEKISREIDAMYNDLKTRINEEITDMTEERNTYIRNISEDIILDIKDAFSDYKDGLNQLIMIGLYNLM